MSSPEITINEWQEVAEQALSSVVVSMLGYQLDEKIARLDQLPEGLPGVHIALMTPAGTVQLGLLSTEDGCRSLAKMMLESSSQERLSEDDVGDALGEILNILAGAMKGQLDRNGTRLRVGIPCFSDNPLADVLMVAQAHVAVSRAQINSTEAILFVTA